jgi:hypothetical protein
MLGLICNFLSPDKNHVTNNLNERQNQEMEARKSLSGISPQEDVEFDSIINVIDLTTEAPLFFRVPFRVKEGLGEILPNANKIPLYSPL